MGAAVDPRHGAPGIALAAALAAWLPGLGQAADMEFLLISNTDGDHEIYTVRLPGPTVRKLTDNSADDIHAVWSPQGDRIAFISMRGGSADLFVMGADGADQRVLYAGPGLEAEPRWAPDGRRIAFISEQGGSVAVMVVDADGGAPVRMSRGELDVGVPAWSPSGDWVAFTEATPKGSDIALANPATGAYRRLTDEPQSLVSDLGWSPDGRSLLFTYHPKRGFAVARIGLEGGTVETIGAQEGFASDPTAYSDIQPQWSPSSEQILFLSNRADLVRNQLFVMGADGSAARAWTPEGLEVMNASWGPQGQGIAYAQFLNGRFTALYQPGPDAEPVVLVADGGVQFQPRARPMPTARLAEGSR